MKLHDTVIGALLIALGLWIVFTASGFPKLTGQPIGPGTFPVALGILCSLGGVGIGLQGLRNGGQLVQIHAGWRRKDRIATVLVMFVGTALLALTFEDIGFPLGGTLLLSALFVASGKRHAIWIVVAASFVCIVFVLLTRVLHVPLPAGVLKGVF